ncbi:MAG: DEAD/DEAH box helicase [Chlamydiota bacterium]
MQLPSKLQKYQKKAQKLIGNGRVCGIEFSGETYQVLVKPEQDNDEKEFWAFLQLDSLGAIQDAFCACEESEEEGSCVHIAAAYLRIYNHRKRPLHARFRQSLWNEICKIMVERVGDDPSLLETDETSYFIRDGNKLVFSISSNDPQNQKKLDHIVKEREEETEETSLKFSNLNEQELALWREGKPTPELKYELSYWNDIAKWLMTLQDERKTYNILFEYSEDRTPISMRISFPEIDIFFDLPRKDLTRIIPYLNSVNSPLAVHTTQREAIQQITYDKKSGSLEVQLKDEFRSHEQDFEAGDKKYQFNGWIYKPGEGFYAIDQHHILAQRKITGQRLSDVLDSHTHVVQRLLVGDELFEEPVNVNYSLKFDDKWDLHVEEYLFEPGDLIKGNSRSFGDWAYIDGKGFYNIVGRHFKEKKKTIPSEELHHYVTKYRTWLSNVKGFETNLMPIELRVGFSIDRKGDLVFERILAADFGDAKSKDFGPWVYIEGQGFYSKVTSNISLTVDPGTPIHREDVPSFIRGNREELSLIHGFFNPVCPIKSAYMDIEIVDHYTLRIVPVYEYIETINPEEVIFYNHLVYVKNRGFYELPLALRLPEKYSQEVIIKGNREIEEFIGIDLYTYRHQFGAIDYRVHPPENLRVEAEKIVSAEKKGKSVYGFQLMYVSDHGKIGMIDVWKAIQSKKKYLFSEAGLIKLQDSRFDWVAGVQKKQVDLRSSLFLFSTLEFLKIDSFDEIFLRKSRRADYKESKEIFDMLKGIDIKESPDISQLKSDLRPYQETGVKWLWYLYLNNLSGLLCDDMGLGKTHQSMALIAAIRAFHNRYQPNQKIHFLVICPTSVIYHWEEKLQQFLPGIRVCTFHGTKRSIKDFKNDYDILLTSYGIWRNESEFLKQVPFELAIFDEVQIAKNHTSRVHRTLLLVNAKMRLGLTGTPIENQIRELKSLFDIVLPKYMPNEKIYIEQFIKPIEKEQSEEKKLLLNRFIKPFTLRRKKEDVLTDLPPKTEEISHCDLLPDQHSLYNEVLKLSHRKIIQELRDQKNPVPYIHIFALLSNLKQICNHPAVYHKDPKNFEKYESGKWNLFVELLNEARESQQKVVVFSQYLFMMDIIELHLKQNGIKYASVRGATIRRGEEVKRFNTDPECEVFVGSLQATGLGVDLTSASVVIHYDRWWNAAREDQATDRVHRIGQTRGVQVFKLVTKNTFEEKIDALILKKGQLMEEVVGTDDHQFVKTFSRSELEDLLDYVEW